MKYIEYPKPIIGMDFGDPSKSQTAYNVINIGRGLGKTKAAMNFISELWEYHWKESQNKTEDTDQFEVL